jgi:hypothetical protein
MVGSILCEDRYRWFCVLSGNASAQFLVVPRSISASITGHKQFFLWPSYVSTTELIDVFSGKGGQLFSGPFFRMKIFFFPVSSGAAVACPYTYIMIPFILSMVTIDHTNTT